MLSVAVFYPKSQLGLISLHLFWVIKNCLCTCFLFPDSAFSLTGERKLRRQGCSTLCKSTSGILLPKGRICTRNALHVSRHCSQLSRAAFCLRCTEENVFSLWPSATFGWFLQLRGSVVGHRQTACAKSINLCFWPPTILFLCLCFVFYLDGQDLKVRTLCIKIQIPGLPCIIWRSTYPQPISIQATYCSRWVSAVPFDNVGVL